MHTKEQWQHLKRLVVCCIRNNMRETERNEQPLGVQKYCEGKARAYMSILGWMIDLENNKLLFQSDSTIIHKGNVEFYVDNKTPAKEIDKKESDGDE